MATCGYSLNALEIKFCLFRFLELTSIWQIDNCLRCSFFMWYLTISDWTESLWWPWCGSAMWNVCRFDQHHQRPVPTILRHPSIRHNHL